MKKMDKFSSVNNRLHYRKALLNIIPFNDYSGSYDGSLLKIFLENQKDNFSEKEIA